MNSELMRQTGRKISDSYEHPLDNWIIDYVCSYVNPWLYNLNIGIVPNHLTIISGGLGLYSNRLVIQQYYLAASGFFAISYIFDCLDGNYARRYNMETDFGDWLDHLTDVIEIVSMSGVILLSPYINSIWKYGYSTMLIVNGGLMSWHIGCQEKNYRELEGSVESVLTPFESLCQKKEDIEYSRYFGCANFMGGICLFLLLIR